MESSTDVGIDNSPSSEIMVTFNVGVVILGLIGMVGNGIVIIAMLQNSKLRKKDSSILILNQSLVDLTGSLFLSMTSLYRLHPYKVYGSVGSYLACYLFDNRSLMFSSMTASTFSLVVITVERFAMVVHPILHRNAFTSRLITSMAAAAWIFGFLWTFPPAIPTTYLKDGVCITFDWPSYEMQQDFGLALIAITFFLPIIVFIYLYGHILVVLHKKNKRIHPNEAKNSNKSNHVPSSKRAIGSSQVSRAQVNVTRTMIIVSVAFAVCWTPNQIYYLMFNLGCQVDFLSPLYLFTLFFSFMNCCINPFIYAFKYDALKDAVKACLPCLVQRTATGSSATHTTSIRNRVVTVSHQENYTTSGFN